MHLQIETKKRKQMEERQKQKQQEIAEEQRLKQERQTLNQQYQSEIENEAMKKDHDADAVKTETKNTMPVVDKGELVRLKYAEEMQKKRLKQKEQQERLDQLAEKMATLPQSVYTRSTSPPIPTIRARSSQTSSTLMPPTDNPCSKSEIENSPRRCMYIDSNSSECDQQPFVQEISSLPSQTGRQFVFPTVVQTKSLQSSQRLPSPGLQIISSAPLSASDKKQEVLKILGTIKKQVKQAKQHIPSQTESSHTMPQPVVASFSDMWHHPDNTYNHSRDDVYAMKTFTDLKYKDMSASRMEFWEQYPQPPHTNSALELQQSALLTEQSRKLERSSERTSQEGKQILYNHK